MHPHTLSIRLHDGGMVLIAVLWMVVALSIMVTGLTRSVREESRLMSRARQNVEALALGDAAIQITLQSLLSQPTPVGRIKQEMVVYRGVFIAVQIMPLNGLIDINSAPVPLLARMYHFAGGLPSEAADTLAQATVSARERKDLKGNAVRFEAGEDLLQVPGVDYDLYARLSDLVTADLRSSGKVNPMAAPPEVLAVLAGGDVAVASRIAADRNAGLEAIDTTALETVFTDSTIVRRFCIQARVPLADGAWLHTSRTVDLSVQALDGMPWRTFRTKNNLEPMTRKAIQ